MPSELCRGLVEAAHCSPSAGHGGIHKTLARIREKYYWPGMVRDVQQIVSECEACKVNKTQNVFRKPPMGKQQITERPFQRLYVDFMGPYPRTKDGNVFVFVCLDHFSKFVFLKPMQRATAAKVVQYLEREVFHVFGVPEFVHSDNGKQFVAELFTTFLERYGVNHIRTAFYSPQANAAERVNRSVLQMIRSYLGANQKNWDQHVSDAAFALRSVVHTAIGESPYYVVFGMPMVQHGGTYNILRKLGSIKDSDCVIDLGVDKHQIIRNKVFGELRRAYKIGEKVYNTRAKEIEFKIGQMVYRRNFKQSSLIDNYNAKLGPKHIQCVVLGKIGNSLYELGDSSGKN